MAILDLITVGDPTIQHVDADPSAGGGLAAEIGSLALFDNAGTGELYLKDGAADTDWAQVATGAVGESNTASNQGAGGVGVFKQKTGVDLEFRNINVASNKLTVALDAGNDEVDLDVAEANLDMGNMGGIVGVDNGGTGLDASTVLAGQLLIGNDTNNDFDLATLTAGDGIAITNADGSITIAKDGAAVSTVQTTDATQTVAQTIAMATADTVYHVTAKIMGIVSGGTGGNDQDAVSFVRTFTAVNDGGTLTLLQTQSDQSYKAAALSAYGVDGNVSGTDLQIRVTGQANDNVEWKVDSCTVSHA